MDYRKLAEFLVGYSAGVRPGEVVSLLGPPAVAAALVAIYGEVLRAGGHPIVLMRPEVCDEMLAGGDATQVAFVDPLAAREVEAADVAIHVLPVPVFTGKPSALGRLQAARRPLLDLF